MTKRYVALKGLKQLSSTASCLQLQFTNKWEIEGAPCIVWHPWQNQESEDLGLFYFKTMRFFLKQFFFLKSVDLLSSSPESGPMHACPVPLRWVFVHAALSHKSIFHFPCSALEKCTQSSKTNAPNCSRRTRAKIIVRKKEILEGRRRLSTIFVCKNNWDKSKRRKRRRDTHSITTSFLPFTEPGNSLPLYVLDCYSTFSRFVIKVWFKQVASDSDTPNASVFLSSFTNGPLAPEERCNPWLRPATTSFWWYSIARERRDVVQLSALAASLLVRTGSIWHEKKTVVGENDDHC